jgi:hypothetical protein
MNKTMIANRPMTYGTRRLKAGDEFTAPRRDADLLNKIGRARLVEATDKPDPLDHDKDGKKGGSPKSEASDEMAALRSEYQSLVGKRPFHGWDAETIKAKIAEARG